MVPTLPVEELQQEVMQDSLQESVQESVQDLDLSQALQVMGADFEKTYAHVLELEQAIALLKEEWTQVPVVARTSAAA